VYGRFGYSDLKEAASGRHGLWDLYLAERAQMIYGIAMTVGGSQFLRENAEMRVAANWLAKDAEQRD